MHDDADEGVVDVWEPWLTGTPIAEDPSRGSVWRLTPPPFDGGQHGDWCLQYELQPPRRRTYFTSRRSGLLLPESKATRRQRQVVQVPGGAAPGAAVPAAPSAPQLPSGGQ